MLIDHFDYNFIIYCVCPAGTILDKPEPPPTYMKPRTMSTSSGINIIYTCLLKILILYTGTAKSSIKLSSPVYPKPNILYIFPLCHSCWP